MPDNIIEISHLQNTIGGKLIHDDLSLTVQRGEIVAIVGGSGAGKTTLLRSILMLLKPTAGEIKVFGKNVWNCSEREAQSIRHRWGVMFQSSALFSSLCVLENVMFPVNEVVNISDSMQREIALLKISLAGLVPEDGVKFPAELSGGMKKRAALARAIVLDPELVFLDEPTSGLDPKSAGDFDQLILRLRASLGITFVMITHDLDSLWLVPDRVLFLGEGKVLAALPMAELVKQDNPIIQDYLSGVRGYDRSALALKRQQLGKIDGR